MNDNLTQNLGFGVFELRKYIYQFQIINDVQETNYLVLTTNTI